MKKLSVPCDFEGRPGSFQVWVGRPAPGFHPLRFQAAWLREERGGRLSEDVKTRTSTGSGIREGVAAEEAPGSGIREAVGE